MRQKLFQALRRGPNPHPLTSLVACSALSTAAFSSQGMGTGLPPLSGSFIGVALVSPGDGRRAVVTLTVDAARKLVNDALGRPGHPDTGAMTSFDKGVLLRLAALAAEDAGCLPGVADFEIRGILDTANQLDLFFAPDDDLRWYVSGSLVFDQDRTPCFIIGNGNVHVSSERGQHPDTTPFVVARMADVPVKLRLEIGQTSLGVSILDTLEAGDVITLDALSLPAAAAANATFVTSNEIVLRSGDFTRTAIWLDTDTFQLKESMAMTESFENTRQLQPPTPVRVTDIDISCTVELGELHMTVKDASALIPGQILKLNQPVRDEVYLRAGNRLLCKGQLVMVADELALEITEVP